MITAPPPVPRPCEKCGGDFINEGLAMSCRLCGRRWHPECSTGVKLCPRCTRPLQSVDAVRFIAENRISRRRVAWLAIPATCAGAWALTVVIFVLAFTHLGISHGKPWFFEIWWIAAITIAAGSSATLWVRFFRRRIFREGIIATLTGMVVCVLITAAGIRDAPRVDNVIFKLGAISLSLFGSTIVSAIRWEKMPQR
jgi:hypothetical protein